MNKALGLNPSTANQKRRKEKRKERWNLTGNWLYCYLSIE
jgi:hypothetical protein